MAKSGTQGTHPLNGSPIAAQAGKTDYSFAWTVKEPLGADYTLRLIYRDGAAQEVTHADSGVFAIVAPQLTLTSPLEGASLTFGAQTDVTWTVDHALSAGSFDLVAESGLAVNAAPIAVDPAKTSYSFAWAPTLALGGGHTLHLVYKDAAGQERASSTPPVSFSVVAPTVTVTAPLAGAQLDFGVETDVTWTVDHALSAGTFDLVASSQTLGLEYPLNTEPIAADPAKTTYSYSWTVAQLPAADYQIKVIYFDERRAADRLRRVGALHDPGAAGHGARPGWRRPGDLQQRDDRDVDHRPRRRHGPLRAAGDQPHARHRDYPERHRGSRQDPVRLHLDRHAAAGDRLHAAGHLSRPLPRSTGGRPRRLRHLLASSPPR